jgi:hypothetical protein
LAYDGVSLLKALKPVEGPFSAKDFTVSRGFQGVEGLFRFSSQGVIDRAFAILKIHEGQALEVHPAPEDFSSFSFSGPSDN